ncbi:unspecified product, partial [Plasmodium ovale curtisi]
MADNLGYTTLTHYIPIEVFFAMIESDIKKLIHTHGHKNCGLMHEELCKEIQKVITQKKNIVFQYMDKAGKNKWHSDWNSKRIEFFNKLFEEEGFINMCYPKKYTKNPSLDQLLSKHIKFCKKKDERRATLEKTSEYSECVNYNSWIDTERKSFTLEYLKNVRNFKSQTVNKYFSTKEHPSGHDPRETYHRSKLDCEIYNPTSNRYQKKTVEKSPKNKPQLPRVPNIISGSQGKDGSSPTDKDSRSAKTEPEENKSPRPKSRTPDSRIPSRPKTQTDDTSSFQNTPVKTEALGSPVNRGVEKKESIFIQGQYPTNIPPRAQAEAPPQTRSPPHPPEVTSPTSAIQSVPSPTATTSSSSSLPTVKDTTSSKITPTSSSLKIIPDTSLITGLPSLPDQHPPPLPPATEGQDKISHSTPGTSSDTNATTHPTISVPSTKPVDSSLSQLQVPVLNVSPIVTAPEVLGTPASSSASTITTTFTTTTATTAAVTIPTMSTIQNPISSTNEAPGILRTLQPPTGIALNGSKVTSPATDPQQTPLSSPTPRADKDTKAKSAADTSPKANDPIQATDNPLSKDTQQASGNPSKTRVTIPHSKVQRTPYQIDQQNNTRAPQHPPNISVVPSTPDKSGASVNTPIVNTKAISKDDSTVRTNKNDNPSIIPQGITPLEHIIPTLLVILATVTLLFQLYKYTPFGFLLGRRGKRKKRDLRRIFEIPEKPTYESPNITVHEWEDPNLIGQTVENDVYTKLLKINRYKQEMQKRKKKNKTTLIEVHMHVLEEYKNDEWELHKGDFLEICLRGFINEENDNFSKLPNTELTIKSTKNDKIIE